MICETIIRVRYSETDQMGIVYYSNYFVWMEVGRTDLIRKSGITYKQIEENGFLLPVVYASAKFIGSAYYDDEIIIQSGLIELSKIKLSIGYRIYRKTENNRELICVGLSDLVFLDKNTRKITKAPEFFTKSITITPNQEYYQFLDEIKRHLKI